MITLQRLLKKISKSTKKEKEKIKEAYLFAKKAHTGQKLGGSKTNYITHPLFASYILAKWKQDTDVICAMLLHDVIEDCEISIDTIRRKFGERVAFYVDGMSWFRTWNNKKKRYLKRKRMCIYC